MQSTRSIKFCKNMPYMYIIKVKKFWVCAYLRLGSIKENIEGDANLHHPPHNRVKVVVGPKILGGFNTSICHKLSEKADAIRFSLRVMLTSRHVHVVLLSFGLLFLLDLLIQTAFLLEKESFSYEWLK